MTDKLPNTAESFPVEMLMNAAAFDHDADAPELVETHISWVVLAGDCVYKLKKPVKLDFLDFRDLEQRRFYCEEELRLNRLWAPELYLDVVPITLDNGQPKIGGDGEPVEYAVRMRRFDQSGLLDRELERGTLTVDDMHELANHVAERHLAAPIVDKSERKRVIGQTKKFMRDNFLALEGVVDERSLSEVRDWTEQQLAEQTPTLIARFDAGFVRICHGDLHLRNLVRLPTGITAFDCVEFDKDLRHIDVFCDIAFLLIDLVARRHHDLAAHFLNRYLERTGDYHGMAVFSLFFVYRCLVRAKVAAIRAAGRDNETEKATDLEELAFYFDMAKRQIAMRSPVLVVMSGLSGSGKSWVSNKLMGAMPAIRVRSDIERKRIFGIEEAASSHSEIGAGMYSTEAGGRVYARLFDIARSMLDAGHNVILDAAFIRQTDRRKAIDIAKRCGWFPVVLAVSAPPALMQERLMRRAEFGADVSEAGLSVLEHQRLVAEPVCDNEAALVIEVENDDHVDVVKIADTIKSAARR